MGITNFHIWLKSYYPDSYIQIKNNNCYDYMYIDVNFILHNAMHGSKSFNEFLKRIHLQFDTIFSNVIATKQIYFALDGPSSYAKILLQRKRREVAGGKVTNTKINSLYITPGIRMILILENDNTNIKYISNENNESFDESEEDSFDTDDDETQTKITEYYK